MPDHWIVSTDPRMIDTCTMPAEIYLDTARLGRMCPGARRAEQAFATLASQLGSSLYLERFLAHGFESLCHHRTSGECQRFNVGTA